MPTQDQFEKSRVPDFEDSAPRRRVADQPEFAHMPPDLWRLLTDIRDRGIRMESHLSSLNGAFVKDEDGKPDYYGHREAHKSMMKDAKTLEGIKGDLTKKIAGGVVVLALSMLGSGALMQLKDLLK